MVKQNWTTEDEEQLCYSYLEVSMGSIVGRNQKHDIFWKHLNNHWAIIDEADLKFFGCYQRAQYTNFDALRKTMQARLAEVTQRFIDLQARFDDVAQQSPDI
ncbi:hypothetical protein BDF21DRAFT_462496 [Thamnidium elegans]|uniref:Uncharacterized protein n=1 Tax=Thamnidium elegans TaxID=101142 RepID=A0A8H7VWD6_9FUNG|nr:hypothetical protein INT48_003351 [Thamnidium elegans]KAI8082425.1 hypothetical protein BDF21DRAFT_462496 [Thamnidium elegans]